LKKFNSSPLKKALTARWKFYAALLIVLGSLGAYNLAINTFVAGSGEATVVEEPSMATPEYIINAADSIDVLFQVTEIDTIREFIQVEYEFNPYGIWGQKDLYDGETPRGSSALILKPFVVQYEAAGLDRDPRGEFQTNFMYRSTPGSVGFKPQWCSIHAQTWKERLMSHAAVRAIQ
jgi:hypothetical protein